MRPYSLFPCPDKDQTATAADKATMPAGAARFRRGACDYRTRRFSGLRGELSVVWVTGPAVQRGGRFIRSVMKDVASVAGRFPFSVSLSMMQATSRKTGRAPFASQYQPFSKTLATRTG